MNVQSKSATGGSRREDYHADYEDSAPAKQVTKRASDKNQGRQEQSVRLDHPLHVDHGRMKTRLQRRQNNIDHRAVNERHAGPKNGRSKYPGPRSRSTRISCSRSPDYAFVA